MKCRATSSVSKRLTQASVENNDYVMMMILILRQCITSGHSDLWPQLKPWCCSQQSCNLLGSFYFSDQKCCWQQSCDQPSEIFFWDLFYFWGSKILLTAKQSFFKNIEKRDFFIFRSKMLLTTFFQCCVISTQSFWVSRQLLHLAPWTIVQPWPLERTILHTIGPSKGAKWPYQCQCGGGTVQGSRRLTRVEQSLI